MFNALKAALKGSEWTTFEEVKHPVKPEYPSPVYPVACLIGQPRPDLIDFITKAGLGLTDQPKKSKLMDHRCRIGDSRRFAAHTTCFEKMEKERGNGTGIEHRTEIE